MISFMIIDKHVNTLTIFEDLSRHIDRQAARKISEILEQVCE